MKRLKDKTAIVTGSTSGIGEATARLFAEEGAKVIIAGRRREKGEQIAVEIRKDGGEAIFIQADMTQEEDIQKLVNSSIEAFGKIDILVNNAGRIIEKPFIELTREDWDQFVALDAFSYFRMMQLVLPHMERQGSGNIVNVTSLAAISVMPTHALYSFVKAGITHMSKVVAAEYADKGIRVNCLLPGVVYTEMIADNPNTPHMEKIIPMGRMSTSEEQAKSILFLASEDSSYMTGTSMVADGGIRGI
ncbi:SDR family oxidoreductase [Planococcus shenhongbingii]|uniref:SDR family NAD(P)-dependent oxidoreductase n=1 Tax=Planococcus shenhongbingii TaxID=3058398 RepID=UPI00262CBA35|nr:SDR family oxidoreductase [Planococcus sp. N016]WKA59102.1 SDR family oxidoreductase [Planococcus sp. N016]